MTIRILKLNILLNILRRLLDLFKSSTQKAQIPNESLLDFLEVFAICGSKLTLFFKPFASEAHRCVYFRGVF